MTFCRRKAPAHSNKIAGFQKRTEIANWVNVAALVVTFFLLVSFVVLPVKWTHRHYLSVCLTIGVMFIEVCTLHVVIVDSAKSPRWHSSYL
jgi:hypothetical protein